MSLRIAARPDECHESVVEPGSGVLQRVALSLVRLADGEMLEQPAVEREVAIVILGGTCTITAGAATFPSLGRRPDVFGGRATAVYLPAGIAFTIRGEGPVEAAICSAPASHEGKPVVVRPEDVLSREVGQHNWRRRVEDVIGGKVPAASLLVGETYNPPGNWSSYPPHKHDEDRYPDEVVLEEVYHYRMSPPQGYGLQRVYTADGSLDECYAIRNGDSVVIPKGYHPVVAAPGYSLYYLWILAGPRRIMRPCDDPAHAWVKNVESVIAQM